MKRMTGIVSCLVLVGGLGWGPGLRADAPNTAVLDGIPGEYDGADLRGTYTGAPGFGAANTLKKLYLTWDNSYLYIALEGTVSGNKLAVLLDVDPGMGTGATTTTNWTGHTSSSISYNDVGWIAGGNTPFGLDYMVASEGLYNAFLRIGYDGEEAPVPNVTVTALFDQGNGAAATGSPVDMAMLSNDSTVCLQKGLEARIPWSELYAGSRFGAVLPGEVIPRGASLRLFANLHNNNPDEAYSAEDVIPAQSSAGSGWAGGIHTTEDYMDVPLDGDLNGQPDGAPGDVNAPYLVQTFGAAGGSQVYLRYQEDVTGGAVTMPASYSVGGVAPTAVTSLGPRIVRLDLAAPLSAGAERLVVSTGIEDAAANSRISEACLYPVVGGIAADLTVTFTLETASGFGPTATEFFLNGDAFPLQGGALPMETTPLSPVSGSQVGVSVTFPAGSPGQVRYRYSGRRSGTNTYEAVRLTDYETAQRILYLDTMVSPGAVIDHLGAHGVPARSGGDGFIDLNLDPLRGDAGVRQRQEILFQLDLGTRALDGVTRVLVQGSDPLRGFNSDYLALSDYAGNALVGWDEGGIELFDDATHGDLVAGDGLYMRTWAATPTGTDPVLVPGAPSSLVGGDSSTPPYYGIDWLDARSPRSMIYKYYVVRDGVGIESPAANLEMFLPETGHVVLDPFVWDNDLLPKLSASFPAGIVEVARMDGFTQVVFTNILLAADNEVEVAADAASPWRSYGITGTGSELVYTARVAGVESPAEMYRVVTPGRPGGITYWEPSILPPAGGSLRLYYNQNHRALAGDRDIFWFGANPFPGAFLTQTMDYLGLGWWKVDLQVAAQADGHVQFLFVDKETGMTIYDKNGGTSGPDYRALIGGRSTATPDPALADHDITIYYDAAGGPLAGEPAIHVWQDFDGWEGRQWNGALGEAPMTSTGLDQWEITVNVPASASNTVNWVFKTPGDPGVASWDSNKDSNNTSRDWHVFIQQSRP